MAFALAAAWLPAQDPPEVAARFVDSGIEVDGDLREWSGLDPQLVLADLANVWQADRRGGWGGGEDLSARIHLAYDRAHLYLAGTVMDDDLVPKRDGHWSQSDTLEVFLDLDLEDQESTDFNADDFQIFLMPLNEERPWGVMDYLGVGQGAARPAGSSLTGYRAVARLLDANEWQFEAAIPFHHFTSLRPGAEAIGFQLALNDHDRDKPDRYLYMTWTGENPVRDTSRFGRLRFLGPGPMSPEPEGGSLLGQRLLQYLPFFLAPVIGIGLLVLLLRLWSAVRRRMPSLRLFVRVLGLLLFVVGLLLPGWWMQTRHESQQEDLQRAVETLQSAVAKMEEGTLASYRGPSRDRALVDLLDGKAIARQKYTAYRFLSDLASGDFGVAPRSYPDDYFRVRPYWVPLSRNRAEQFAFDPPLRGESLFVVIGRPIQQLPLSERQPLVPQLRVEVPGRRPEDAARTEELSFDGNFTVGDPLGRELYEVAWKQLELRGEVRTLGITALQGEDLHLVGLTLLPRQGEEARPLFLGRASLGGVQTDLRGPHPADAGIELGAGARMRVVIPPERREPFGKLWLIHRAIYPGVVATNVGERVGEVVVRFAGEEFPPRVLGLEHQVSIFYELGVHNIHDQPPPGSPAEVAFSWVDEDQERHLNLVYPVLDLPAGAVVESLEFRNLGQYRIRFRSIVFGSEKAAAPQDPDDSPLVREGQDRRLSEDLLGELDDTAVAIYRGGRLSESTITADRQGDYSTLPQDWRHPDAAPATLRVLEEGEQRRLAAYYPLTGDGWDGAVLGLFSTDRDHEAAGQRASLWGLVLCLLATPILLVLFSEVLTALNNLRVRLIAVLSVAALVPLAVLSVVLVQVLEAGHESEQQRGMRERVQSALSQLEDQKERLRTSARQWLRDLVQVCQTLAPEVPPDASPDFFEVALLPLLQQQLGSQLPPEWEDGFLKLDFHPEPGSALRPGQAVVGAAHLAGAETPARLEPSFFLHWGAVLLGVRAEDRVAGGSLSLTAGRSLGGSLLSALAPGQSMLLMDAHGYPLEAVGDGAVDPQSLMDHAARVSVMAQREEARREVLEKRLPVVARAQNGQDSWLLGYEVLRDLQDTPRALLAIAQRDQRAALDLPVGEVPVRAFFMLVAGLLVVLSVFLSFVVSNRISSPIEQLEGGAQAISRGELGTRVPLEEGGQIGRLTRTFNQMAQDLQSRIADMNLLNRGIRDLTAHLDVNQTIGVVRQFCQAHSPADQVEVAVPETDGDALEVYGPGGMEQIPGDRGTAARDWLVSLVGPCCARAGALDAAGLITPESGMRSALVLPMILADRTLGAVLMLFERREPLPVNLDLLSTMTAQAAVAVENARLYRHAVQDPVTGLFMPDYFRRRVAEEVNLAQAKNGRLLLVGLWTGQGGSHAGGSDRFATLLRACSPEGAVLCHAGEGRFQVLVRDMGRAEAEGLVSRVLEAWRRDQSNLPDAARGTRQPMAAFVVFPDEAVSAEFLFDALHERLASGAGVAPAVEFPEEIGDGLSVASPAMRHVYRTLRRVAPTDLTILLEGETGTGKEVLTNLIHRWSKRFDRPLVKVHCAALPETLLQSELFGYEKGAFTGADSRRTGRFEQAQGGTIFLDEIGEISPEVQVKLLRVLQEREIDRLGGTEPIPVDVRVIAATNRDIRQMVAEGSFREDLYYRLQGMVVRVPPLRERKPEIPHLVEHFRQEVVSAGQSRVQAFSPEAMDELFRQPWPGNVRELRNTVFRAMVMATGERVELEDLGSVLPSTRSHAAAPPPSSSPAQETPGVDSASPMEDVEQPPVVLQPEPPRSQPGAKLEGRLRFLYQLIRERGSIRTQDYVDARGVSDRTGLRDLQHLVRQGLVERVGKRRGARYRLANSGQTWRDTRSGAEP